MNIEKFNRDYQALFNSRWKIKNYTKAFPHLCFAAKHGYPHAQNLVGYCYDLGLGTRRDPKAAVHWYKKAATAEYDEAIYNLALCYSRGDGIRKNERKAFDLNQRAAMGHVWASCNLGTMYAEGVGTKTDPALAVKWWRKAAQKGDAKAQYNLGGACLEGDGVRKSERLGVAWLRKAAKLGHKIAARELRKYEVASH
jgi:TPR repeat protein